MKNEAGRADRLPGAAKRKVVAVPEAIWAPVAVGGLLLAVGLIGLLAGQPWLFPSLGPTAFLQAEEPEKPASRFYNTVVGHLVGFAAGVVAVLLLADAGTPSVLADKVMAPERVWAAAFSGVLTMLGLALLKASHPPAAATMLLVALGGIEPTWRGAGMIFAGVLIVAVLGEGVRYLRRDIFPKPVEVPGPQ